MLLKMVFPKLLNSIFFFVFLLGIPKFAYTQSLYQQDIKTDIRLPEGIDSQVLKLFKNQKTIVAVTPNRVLEYAPPQWIERKKGAHWITATVDAQGNLWLASPKHVASEKGKKTILPLPLLAQDSITCLYWENQTSLLAGTTNGLFRWEGSWKEVPLLKASRITDIVKDAQEQLYIATNKGLWRMKNQMWVNLDADLMAVGNEGKYYALTTANQHKDIILSSPYSIASIAEDGNHWVLTSTDGLPYGPVTVIQTEENSLWMGTQKGLIKKDQNWHYYHGKRWLPDDHINDILVLDSARVWIATNKGISEIRKQSITLAQKADSIESIIDQRHNRRGLINRSILKNQGDLSSSYMQNEDNDGLWTATYLAAECFRYGATQSEAAKTNAIRTFEALERLETISGISGYPARSYVAATDSFTQSRSPHPKVWHLSADKKWYWLDDTSSDEITGHMFVLPLFYDLVANDQQKERVVQLIKRIADHIVDHNYHLIDFDGKPTRWGVWHPDSLNHAPNWIYERGLNALQILSFMKTASFFTKDPKFEKHYQLLVNEHGYAQNALYAKQYGPFETSHSDDILNFFPYYNLLKYSQDDPHRETYIKSLKRSWKAVQNDHMPVWNVFASALLNQDCDLQIALKEIQEYPMDLIDWTMDNSHRWDIEIDPLISRFRRKQARRPIPTPESGISRWNTNPKELKSGADGTIEDSGTYFLFAYWMGRYNGYWE
jgi:hypothetical protein